MSLISNNVVWFCDKSFTTYFYGLSVWINRPNRVWIGLEWHFLCQSKPIDCHSGWPLVTWFELRIGHRVTSRWTVKTMTERQRGSSPGLFIYDWLQSKQIEKATSPKIASLKTEIKKDHLKKIFKEKNIFRKMKLSLVLLGNLAYGGVPRGDSTLEKVFCS